MITVAEKLKQYNAEQNAKFDSFELAEIDPAQKPRLFLHDLVHMLANAENHTVVGENRAAIFQAVLLRDTSCNNDARDYAPHTLDALPEVPAYHQGTDTIVDTHIIIKNYTERKGLKKADFKTNEPRNVDSFIRAIVLEEELHNLLGRSLSTFTAEEIAGMDFAIFEEALAKPIYPESVITVSESELGEPLKPETKLQV